jgi:Tol biopolymer transport system component
MNVAESNTPEAKAASNRLDQWKGVADYLGRDVSTAIRWAKNCGLPVHRVPGKQRRRPVFAYRSEIDDWLAASDLRKKAPARNGWLHGKPAVRFPHPSSPSEKESASIPGQATETTLGAKRSWKRWGLAATAFSVVFLAVVSYQLAAARFSLHSPQLIGIHQLTSNGMEKYGLLTAGKQLYFGQYQNGWLALAAMPVDGGPVRLLWTPAMNVLPMDISPDGKFLLALNDIYHDHEREIWEVPLDGRSPHRLGSLTAHSLAYAPDGRSIAYATRQSIYLATANGSSSRQIGTYTAVPDSLHWSSDGTRLYFSLLDSVSRKLSLWALVFTNNMATISLRSVPSPVEPIGEFNWASARQNDSYFYADHRVWFVQYNRAWWQPAMRVTDLHIDMNGNGGIAFDRVSNRLFAVSDEHDHGGIQEFNPHTKDFRYILPGISGTYPDYSHDKQWIAWVDYSDTGGSALWIARADGSAKKLLVSFKDDIELPRWSPDGTQIAFMGKETGHPYRIYIVHRDGGQPRKAASEGSDNQGAPTWSPDGRFLAYGNVVCLETHSCAVHTIDLATGEVRTLPDSEGLMTARWSPDGRHIAAMRPELHQLLVFNMNQQHWRKLADSVDSADLGWSSDSKSLFAAFAGKDAHIARISATTGKQETVLSLEKLNTYNLTTVHDGVFAVTPDNDLLFSRPAPFTEIFSWAVQDR